MRISDWSSDVCASDLIALRGFHPVDAVRQHRLHPLPYGALDLGAERRDARRVAASRPAGGKRGIAGGQRPSPEQSGLASAMKADRVRADTQLATRDIGRLLRSRGEVMPHSPLPHDLTHRRRTWTGKARI